MDLTAMHVISMDVKMSQQRESHMFESSQHRSLIEGCLEVKVHAVVDRWKSTVGKSQRRVQKMTPAQKRDQPLKKVDRWWKSRDAVAFFANAFVAPEG